MKNPLLKKIIILFVCLLVPLITIGTFAIYKGNKRLQNQILDSIYVNNQVYIRQLDINIKQIYYFNIPVLEQSYVQKLANISPFLTPYERGVYVNLLREQLSAMCATNPLLESAHVYFLDSLVMYNSKGYDKGSYSLLKPEQAKQFKALEKEKSLVHYYTDSQTKQRTLSIFMAPRLKENNYGMNIVLSQKRLKQHLDSNIAYQDDFYLFYLGDKFNLTNLDKPLRARAKQLCKELRKQNRRSFYEPVRLNDVPYYVFFYKTSEGGGCYARFISANSLLGSVGASTLVVVAVILWAFFSCLVFFAGMYRMVHKPFKRLRDAFAEVETGNFDVQIGDQKPSDFAYIYSAFNDMAARLKHLIWHNYSQKLLLKKAELKQLQAQINPHFLYNSFFMLRGMIKMELTKEALEVSEALGRYFRYITKNSMENVTLREEYEHAKTYAYIQGLRFEGRVEVYFEPLPEGFERLPVPKLILQPILENAFNYGLCDKMEKRFLRTTFSSAKDTLAINIEDNGESLTDEELAVLEEKLDKSRNSSWEFEMSGILNIQRRLTIFSLSASSLKVSRSKLGGLCVTITLSLKKEA